MQSDCAGAAGPSPGALIAAFREECAQQGLSPEAVAERADREELVARMETGKVLGEEMLVEDMAALGKVLGVSASALIARAEEIDREGGRR